jgi:hypothetical protein
MIPLPARNYTQQPRCDRRAFIPAPGKDSAQISQLIGVASDLSIRFMGDKSPKSKNKQAVQKQTKAAVETQKKKDAVSAKQIAKTKK